MPDWDEFLLLFFLEWKKRTKNLRLQKKMEMEAGLSLSVVKGRPDTVMSNLFVCHDYFVFGGCEVGEGGRHDTPRCGWGRFSLIEINRGV